MVICASYGVSLGAIKSVIGWLPCSGQLNSEEARESGVGLTAPLTRESVGFNYSGGIGWGEK